MANSRCFKSGVVTHPKVVHDRRRGEVGGSHHHWEAYNFLCNSKYFLITNIAVLDIRKYLKNAKMFIRKYVCVYIASHAICSVVQCERETFENPFLSFFKHIFKHIYVHELCEVTCNNSVIHSQCY